MNLATRILEWLDAPRFCGRCGEPIRVRASGGFDERTGAEKPHWYWSCPKVSVSLDDRGFISEARWMGTERHVYGSGRPRWHKAQP